MKSNMLKLSVILTLLSLQTIEIITKEKTTKQFQTSQKESAQQHKKMIKELVSAFNNDDHNNLQKLKKFIADYPKFDWHGTYSGLIPNDDQATPLMAAAHHGASESIDHLITTKKITYIPDIDKALEIAKKAQHNHRLSSNKKKTKKYANVVQKFNNLKAMRSKIDWQMFDY